MSRALYLVYMYELYIYTKYIRQKPESSQASTYLVQDNNFSAIYIRQSPESSQVSAAVVQQPTAWPRHV